MPFDGHLRTGFVSLEDMLLDMVEFALDGGKKWGQGLGMSRKKLCLMQAVMFVRRQTRYGTDNADRYLAQAIGAWDARRGHRPSDEVIPLNLIIEFNDVKGRT